MGNFKLNVKKTLVVVLAAILFGMCITTSSFSWFTRPSREDLNGASAGAGSGKELQMNIPQSDYYITGNSALQTAAPKSYDGNSVTMSTMKSTNDGASFTEAVTFDYNLASENPNQSTVASNGRDYYKTTLTNGSGTDQNVSLYIKNFTPGGETGSNMCVGTNVPVKSFKNYSMYGVTVPEPTRNQTNGATKRVYFEPWGAIQSGNAYDEIRNIWKTGATSYYVVSGGSSTDIDVNNGENGQYTQMVNTGYDSPSYTTTKIFYADIPWNHNKLYFTVNDWNGNSKKRTQTFTNLSGDGLSMTQSLRFYLNGTKTDYQNAWAGKATCVGANFAKYYNNATIAGKTDQTINLGLDDSWVSSNTSPKVTYTSSDTSAFTVDSSGVITAKAVTATTTATLTYTVTSFYGDTKTATAAVKVSKFTTSTTAIKAAPIVTNLLIPAGGSQDVYWFVQNGDQMYGSATASGTYTHNGIYLGV